MKALVVLIASVLSLAQVSRAATAPVYLALQPRCNRMVTIDNGVEKTFAKICVSINAGTTSAPESYQINLYRKNGSLAEHYTMVSVLSDYTTGLIVYYPSVRAMEGDERDEAVAFIAAKGALANDAGVVSIKGDKFPLRIK